jgi:hypothetical protein
MTAWVPGQSEVTDEEIPSGVLKAFAKLLAAEPNGTATLQEQAAEALLEYGHKIEDVTDDALEWLFERIEGERRPAEAYQIEGANNQRFARNALIRAYAEALSEQLKTSKKRADLQKTRGLITREKVHRLWHEIRAREPTLKEGSVVDEIAERLRISRRTVERHKPPR